MLNGILLVDKPVGPTSHDIVYKVRRLFNVKRVGHLGTLDPLASGLLIIAIGNATKSAQHLVKSEKEYLFTIKFGFESETDDSEKEIKTNINLPEDIVQSLENILPKFVGEIKQEPPRYSAVKHNGTPLYKWARKGVDIKVEPRTIFIESMKINKIDLPKAEILMKCSSGTYVRSVCRDIGKELGCGAVAESIRRISSGSFKVEDAVTLEKILNLSEIERQAIIIGEENFN